MKSATLAFALAAPLLAGCHRHYYVNTYPAPCVETYHVAPACSGVVVREAPYCGPTVYVEPVVRIYHPVPHVVVAPPFFFGPHHFIEHRHGCR